MLTNRLKKGNTVATLAPSKFLSKKHLIQLKNGRKYLTSLGLKTILSDNIFEIDKFGIAAGNEKQRVNDINNMILNPKVDAIWFFQGGKPANQVLSFINYDAIKKNPKFFIGMSDIDVILNAINKKTGLITFNTSDLKRGRDLDLDFNYSQESFTNRMFNLENEIISSKERKMIRKRVTEGKIVGCNLNCLLKLSGTDYFPNFEDSRIWT